MQELNAKQQRALNQVIDFALLTDRYEVKELTIEGNEYNDSVYVQLEVGLKNDEGTLARSLCRDCYAFSIGKKGGLYYYHPETHKRVYCNYYNVRKLY